MKRTIILKAFLFILTGFSIPTTYSQVPCSKVKASFKKQAEKQAKYGALTVITETEARSNMRSMAQQKATNEARIKLSQQFNSYLMDNLKPSLMFSDEHQANRFEQNVFSQGNSTISNMLTGIQTQMFQECNNGKMQSSFFLLAVMTPNALEQSIDATIQEFLKNEDNASNAITESWQGSSLKANLKNQQELYDKKIK